MVRGAASDRQFSRPLQMQGLQPCRFLLLLSCVAAVARGHRPDRPTVRPPVNVMNESLLSTDAESSVPAKLTKQEHVHEGKETAAASQNASETPSSHQAMVLLQTNVTGNVSKVEANAAHVEKAPMHDKGMKHKDGSMKLIKDKHEETVHPAIARMREQRKNGIRPAGRKHLAQVSTGTGGVLMQTSHPKKKDSEPSKEREPAVKESAEHASPGSKQKKDEEKKSDEKNEKKKNDAKDEKDGAKKTPEDDAAMEPQHDHEEHHHKHHQHHHHHHHGGAHGKHHKHTITEEDGNERASESESEELDDRHAHHRRHGPIVHSQALHMLVLLVLLSLGIAGVAMLVKLWREEILRDVSGSGDGHGATKPIIAKKGPPVPQRADGLVTITKLPTMAETACQQDSG